MAPQQLISKEDLDEVQRWMIQKRLSSLRLGKLIFGPAIGFFVLSVLARGGGWWRLFVLLGVAGVIGWRVLMARHTCDPRDVPQRMAKEKLWVPILLGAVMLVTGAFDSPLLPALALLCFMFGTLAPTSALVPLSLLSAAVVIFLALASGLGFIPDLMPSILGGGSRSPQPDSLLCWKAGFMVFAIAWAAKMSSTIRSVFRQIATDAIESRDEVLRSHDAHTRELTTLTGELAHELKNPLANMKGLAVLISRDVHGKAAERLGVLQGEIDRLGGIVQSFLTFSRPLVPLCQEEVELGELCESVLALHEGMAHDSGVALATRKPGGAATVYASCDERKVKQILINLVQNAIEASPRGTAVELVPLASMPEGARIEVRDRGAGISASIRDRLFQPGMTTKEKGSGLGLALARALARQHGGDVALVDRDGGGSVAVLTLPRAPAAHCPGEAA